METNANDQSILREEYSILSNLDGLISDLEDETIEAIARVESVGETEENRLEEEKEDILDEREEIVGEIEDELDKLQSGLQKMEQLDKLQFGSRAKESAKNEYKNLLSKYSDLLSELDYSSDVLSEGREGIKARSDMMRENDIEHQNNSSDSFQESIISQDYKLDSEFNATEISREIIEPLMKKDMLNAEDREKIRKAIMSGVISEKEIRARGSRVRERYDELIVERNREFDYLQEKRREIAHKLASNPSNEDRERIQAEIEELKIREKKYQGKYSQQDMIKNVLQEYRKIGPAEGDKGQEYEKGWFKSSSIVIESIDSIRPFLPTEWIEKSNSIPITTKHVSRGYFNMEGEKPTIALSTAGSGMQRCAFHEMGHFYEELYPEIRKLEHEFYNRRTSGEELQWLGWGYSKNEVTRFDNFIDPYMGKDYGNTETSGYELFSMGMESVFAGSYNLSRDPEYHNFILGILTTI